MQWTSKQTEENTSKWFKRFAWVPTKLGSSYLQYHEGPWIWFETYYTIKTFARDEGGFLGWRVYGPLYTQEPWDLEDKSGKKVFIKDQLGGHA
jgi:hypothetical protein